MRETRRTNKDDITPYIIQIYSQEETYERRRKFVTQIHADLLFLVVYLVFEVFQDVCRSNKENPSAYWNATLSCPCMASNYENSYLFPISFWVLTMPWIFIISRFTGVFLVL